MMGLTDLSYELLLAYGLPGSITVLIAVGLFYQRLRLTWDPASLGYLIPAFAVLSLVMGLVYNMISVVVLARVWHFQQAVRNEIFFGPSSKRTYLWELLGSRYPDKKEDDKAMVDLVYAMFNSYVPVHIYSRRNYDWYFHMASRNLLVSWPFVLIGLGALVWHYALPLYVMGVVVLVSVPITLMLRAFMLRELDIYYGYYVHVALGYLLRERAAEENGALQANAGAVMEVADGLSTGRPVAPEPAAKDRLPAAA